MTEATKISTVPDAFIKVIKGSPPPDAELMLPVKFWVGPNQCEGQETEPIRRNGQFKIIFEAPASEDLVWKQILLLNFQFVGDSPADPAKFVLPQRPTHLKGLRSCSAKTKSFEWASTDLPDDLQEMIGKLGSDQFVVVKFDLLAEGNNGAWMFIDPGVGIKP